MPSPIDRRHFLGTLAAAAVASRAHLSFPTRLIRVAVLSEPGFPTVDGTPVDPAALGAALDGHSVEYLTVADLGGRLTPERCDVFVSPYGSAFPVDAWPALHRYLTAGGNWVNLGGAPCGVSVSREGEAWRPEPRRSEVQRSLGFVLACAVDASGVREWRPDPDLPWSAALAQRLEARTVWELYCRFSSVADTPDEPGSAGPREAVVRPLVTGLDAGGRAVAAPFLCVNRLEGEFAGGRWVFATHDGPSSPGGDGLRGLIELAAEGAQLFEVRPSLACYRDGERPAVVASYKGKAAGAATSAFPCRLTVYDERDTVLGRAEVGLTGTGAEAGGTARLGSFLPARLASGLYRVEATLTLPGDRPRELHHTTGFWIWDEALHAGGAPLTAGDSELRRGGAPFPVTGTTYMASDVHRKFLLRPNPWLWDRDFGAMRAAGVNLVRTGIWTGWRVFMPDPVTGRIDEGVLRALDAFLLTARRHDLPVIFTLFAFLPESWGGENPYLDPRSLDAQKRFVSGIAGRYGRMRDLVWDLINEPSFCNKDHLWSCRPNYDGFERAAWAAWTRERGVRGGPGGAPLELPSLDDFKEGAGAGDVDDPARTARVLQYRLFAQAQFARWVWFMTGVLRAVNSRQLVTVGQDEAGTRDSPNNLFLAPDLDFTCVHTWWLNDSLAWDEVMTRAPGKPNLVEETGVMFSGRPRGIEPRWEAYARDLLERKMALAVGLAGGAGFIEWVWNSNCYMPSDNEAAIGLLRSDGTAKPELEAFRGVAEFVAQARPHLVGRRPEPVLLVVPHSNMFTARNTATAATRCAVRAMLYGCRVGVEAVSEYALESARRVPRLVIVPSPGVLRQPAWEALVAWARRGALLLVTGPVDADERGGRVARLEALGIRAGGPAAFEAPRRVPVGRGALLWMPQPVEASGDVAAVTDLYRRALAEARIEPAFGVEGAGPETLVHAAAYQAAVLFTVVAEGNEERPVAVRIALREGGGGRIEASLAPGRSSLILVGGRDGKVLARYPPA